MPCFHTHISYEGQYARDAEGEWFADLDAACESARQSARRMISQLIAAGSDAIRLEYHVHNQAGTLLATVPVSASLWWLR